MRKKIFLGGLGGLLLMGTVCGYKADMGEFFRGPFFDQKEFFSDPFFNDDFFSKEFKEFRRFDERMNKFFDDFDSSGGFEEDFDSMQKGSFYSQSVVLQGNKLKIQISTNNQERLSEVEEKLKKFAEENGIQMEVKEKEKGKSFILKSEDINIYYEEVMNIVSGMNKGGFGSFDNNFGNGSKDSNSKEEQKNNDSKDKEEEKSRGIKV